MKYSCYICGIRERLPGSFKGEGVGSLGGWYAAGSSFISRLVTVQRYA